jgi:transcription elongation factor SPT5
MSEESLDNKVALEMEDPDEQPNIDNNVDRVAAAEEAEEELEEQREQDAASAEEDEEPQKKKRLKLIDDIAEDEDDSEANSSDDYSSDEANEEDLDMIDNSAAARLARGVDEDDTLHLSLDQAREQKEAAELVARLEQRYGAEEEFYDDEELYADEDEAGGAESKQSLLPSIKDPKLWLVKCDPGKEDESVMTLLKKYLFKENSRDEKLFIRSAFTTPASKGYVYIEADKEVHVKRAIRGLRALKWWRLVQLKQPVPLP